MQSTPTARRHTLGLSLCLCLLLGCAAGAEEEKAQQQRTTPNGRVEPPTLPPHLMQGGEKNNKLPTIKKNGDCYYDLAGVNETHLEIPIIDRRVQGVTATSRLCSVKSLVLGMSAFLDEDLFTHCPLTNLTLKGKRWRCLQEGRMRQLHQSLGWNVTEATCAEAWYKEGNIAKAYGIKEGTQKLQDFKITGCSIDKCKCNWYFENDTIYNITMDCSGLGLTDDSLVKMHVQSSQIQTINFDQNNLSSVDILIKYLKPLQGNLHSLILDRNQLTALPHLGRSYPNITYISLSKNLIKRIDVEDFKALSARKDFILNLSDNPVRCDSLMSNLKKYIHERCMEGWNHCKHYFTSLTCRNEASGEIVPLHKVSREGYILKVDWWLLLNVTLGFLNIIILYLMIDLIIVLANKDGNLLRRPKMDYVVCWLKTGFCILCSRISVRGGKDD